MGLCLGPPGPLSLPRAVADGHICPHVPWAKQFPEDMWTQPSRRLWEVGRTHSSHL